MKTRMFTALKDGVVVRRGTFQDEELLRKDLPAPEYKLVLDQHLDYAVKPPTYAELRATAYPSMSVLADALFWQSKGDPTKMEAYLAACEEVKEKYPKTA